jgi:DNA modification methylase
MPSEQFTPEPGYYDAAFSSPPYFNLETYTDEDTQCMNSCSNLDQWFEQYVTPTISMLHTALANDGLYAVNIADYKDGKEEFKIVDRWKQVSEDIGFTYVKQLDMLLNVRPGVGNGKLENSYKAEGIYIFKKS